MNGFYERFEKHGVSISLICIALFVFGLISLFYLKFNLLPEIEYPELIVMTSYPNAPPEEVKNLVTAPLEQAAASAKGVKSISSISREGLSVLRVQYRWGTELGISHIELREKMDLLKALFPREVQRPVVINYQASQDAITGFSVISDSLDPRSLFLLCRNDVVPFLEKTEGIARVALQGGERPEISIFAFPEKLAKYGIGIQEIRSAVQLSHRSFGVGFFQDEKHEYLIRVNGEAADYRKLGDIVLKQDENGLVYLRDAARIEYGSEPRESGVVIDGEQALLISFVKQPAFNVIQASRLIDERIETLNERFGGSILFQKVFDDSVHIKSSLRELILAMGLGLIFTVFSVYIFLLNVRASLIVILTIPLSIVSTFIIMKTAGISINLLTLGGFSLAVGMIVDNAVIVVSGVSGALRDGGGERFGRALRRVIPAVFSATFTTVVVFFPVFFLPGILKHVFAQLSLIIVTSLVFSLFFAVTIVPVLLRRMRRAPVANSGRGFGAFCEKAYAAVLAAGFRRKFLFLLVFAVVLVIGVFSSGAIEKRFLEPSPQNNFYLKMFIKRQASYEYTERFSRVVADILKRDGRIERIITEVGVDRDDRSRNLDGLYGANTAVFKIYTRERAKALYDLIEQVREKLSSFSEVDFIVTLPDSPLEKLLMRSEFDARIKVFEQSPSELKAALERIRSYVAGSGAVNDVQSSYYMPVREKSILLKREEMAIYNVDTLSIGEFLAAALAGLSVGTWKSGEHEMPIVLRFTRGAFSSPEELLGFYIKNGDGKAIRLDQVLSVREDDAPMLMLRENQRGFASLEFNYSGRPEGRFFFHDSTPFRKNVEKRLSSERFNFQYEDQFTLLRENYRELLLALFLALFLEYGILASTFRSFSKPLLVVGMIPLSLPGLFLILYLLGVSLNINTFMSLIALIGLLVNNGIMLFLEYEETGVADEGGVLEASVRRLQPILITTLSTILALIPILFINNRIQVSLAATLIAGLLFSTASTIIYLPMLYSLLYLKRGARGMGLDGEGGAHA